MILRDEGNGFLHMASFQKQAKYVFGDYYHITGVGPICDPAESVELVQCFLLVVWSGNLQVQVFPFLPHIELTASRQLN